MLETRHRVWMTAESDVIQSCAQFVEAKPEYLLQCV